MVLLNISQTLIRLRRTAKAVALYGAQAGLVSAALAAGAPSTVVATPATLGVLQFIEHPSLDALKTAALAHLRAKYPDVNVLEKNAQGSMASATQIAKLYHQQKVSLIFAIGTPAAQVSIAGNSSIPVVFGPITDPIAAKLVASLERPQGVASGVSDRTDLFQQVALIKQITPQVKSVGIIYNAAEANSAASVKIIREAVAGSAMQLQEATVNSTADVILAAKSLLSKKVDALFLPVDNTVASADQGIMMAARQAKVPVYSAYTSPVAGGALASVGVNYTKLGEQAGLMMEQLLASPGLLPQEMPVHTGATDKLVLNKTTAKELGIELGAELLKTAELIE